MNKNNSFRNIALTFTLSFLVLSTPGECSDGLAANDAFLTDSTSISRSHQHGFLIRPDLGTSHSSYPDYFASVAISPSPSASSSLSSPVGPESSSTEEEILTGLDFSLDLPGEVGPSILDETLNPIDIDALMPPVVQALVTSEKRALEGIIVPASKKTRTVETAPKKVPELLLSLTGDGPLEADPVVLPKEMPALSFPIMGSTLPPFKKKTIRKSIYLSDQELIDFKKYRADGLSYGEIAKKMDWNDTKNINEFTALYNQKNPKLTAKQIADMMGTTLGSIRYIIEALGFSTPSAKPRAKPMRWTEEKIAILRRKYEAGRKSHDMATLIPLIAKGMGLNKEQIKYALRKKLGISLRR